MPKQKKERGNVVSIDMVTSKCLECKADYSATKTTYQNGDIVISPQRCIPCQTAHLTGLRVNKTVKDFQLLGNLKTRLSDVQRDAVIDALTTEFNILLDKYSGSTVKSSAFDLKKATAKLEKVKA